MLSAIIIAILFSTTKFKNTIWVFAVLFLSVAATFIVQNQLFLDKPVDGLGGTFIVDSLSTVFRLLALITTILIILGSVKYSEGFTHKGEYIILMLSALLGAMFLVGANDIVTLFVALETLGLSSIMLAGYSKYDFRSNEAALKYLLNSAAATAIFLFGLSLLYGLTSSTQFYEIKYVLTDLYKTGNLDNSIVLIMITMVIGGLAFKLASAPFHMWSPDVYEGAPTPTTAFLSIVSKAAAVALSIRVLFYLFNFAISLWQPILIVLSVLSMILGNLVALAEVRNKASIKRLMAYSSIAQVGYILIGIALATPETISASIFYMIVYAIMNTGAFLCITAFGNEANSDKISDYSGLAKKSPLLALSLAICLFNLGGLPVPPAGFIAKFILIKSAFETGSIGVLLGIIALATTVVSIYYYSYIAKIAIADEPSNAVSEIGENKNALGKSSQLTSAITVAVIGVFMLFVFSSNLLSISNKSANSVNSKYAYTPNKTCPFCVDKVSKK